MVGSMKVKVITGVVLLVVAVIVIFVVVKNRTAGVAEPGKPIQSEEMKNKTEKGAATDDEIVNKEEKACATKYQMKVSLDTKNKVLSGTICAAVKNETEDDLKSICVRNWATAILKGKKNRSEICSARIGSENLQISKKEDASVIYLSAGDRVLVPAGGSVRVEFSFSTEIPKQKNRFGYVSFDGHEMYQLSFCFPQISLYQKGAWNENPYMGDSDETYVNEVADYEVTLLHPDIYTVAATGTEQVVDGGTQITGRNLREFAAVVSDDFSRIQDREGATAISVYGPNYSSNRRYYEYSLKLAKEAVRIFAQKIGAGPFSEIKIVHCFFDGAMEYPGLCMIGMPDVKNFRKISKNSYSGLESHVPHEIAHQWFYAAVGNDSYAEPWLDEGFSEFCEDILFPYFAEKKLQKKLWGNLYTSRRDMDRWFQKVVIPQSVRTKPVNRKVSDYQKNEGEYSTCVYEGGKLFLYELWKTMGDETFFKMMRNYYQTYQFQIASTSDFLEMVRSYRKDKKVEKIIRRYIEE